MSQNNTFRLPSLLVTINSVTYPIIMSIGVVGNIMVLLVVLKIKDMRNTTNIHLANLAIADLLTLFVWGTEVVSVHISSPDHVDIMCRARYFLGDIATTTSVLTILAIGFERYYAICKPLKAGYVCTKHRAFRTCLMVWSIAALCSCPQLLFRAGAAFMELKTKQYDTTPNHEPFCTDGDGSHPKRAYYIISDITFFFLPLLILTTLFVVIARHLKAALAPEVNSAAIRHRRQAITMLATVVVCFFVCLLPFRVYQFLNSRDDALISFVLGKTDESTTASLMFLCRSTLYLHTAVNPILYNLMSKRFRAGFITVCCHFARIKLKPSADSSHTGISLVSSVTRH